MIKLQLRTEIAIRKLVHVWDGKESTALRFTDIKDSLGWNNRKTSDILKKAIREGFVEKVDGKYRSKLPDYNGYFDALDFIKKVDGYCRKQGLIQSFDYYLYIFSPFHVLAYGTPSFKDLTPIESEMLEVVVGRMVAAFSDFINLCDAIKKRIDYEKHNKPLPDFVKSNLFVEDKGESTQPKPLDITAAHIIYGDALWEHVFYNIVSHVRLALEKGSLDFAGPEELMQVRNKIVNLALNLAKRIYRGEFSSEYAGDKKFLDHLSIAFNRLPGFRSDFKSLAYSVILTPSPRTIAEYSEPVGKIIEDCFRLWRNFESSIVKVRQKGESIWEDILDVNGKLLSRKTLFKQDLINKISIRRARKKDVISVVDEKFMLRDHRLLRVFNIDEIRLIIDSVRNLIKRAKKFHKMLDRGIPIEKIKKDPEWFTDEELHGFKIASDVLMRAEWERNFGTNTVIKFEIPADDSKAEKFTIPYMRKLRKRILKG